MAKNFFIAFVIISTVILQTSFIDPFVVGITPISIIVLFLTLMAFRLNLIPLLWWAFLVGVLQEFYSILPFGTYIVVTILTAITLYYLLKNILTNKSLFPFVLMAGVGSIIHNLLLLGASTIFYLFNTTAINLYHIPGLWTGILLQSIVNSGAAFILFLLLRSLTKRFQNQFLVRK